MQAIRSGDIRALQRLLAEHPELATARLGADNDAGTTRTLLHVATDWPGHFPNAPASVGALVAAGADVNAPFTGPHSETPLHWAASSDDVEVLDALIAIGADREAPGSVINGGTPLADAVDFGQWNAARRLIEHGAEANLWQAAALGLLDRVERELAAHPPPGPDEITGRLLVRLSRRPTRDRRVSARTRRRPRLDRLRRPHRPGRGAAQRRAGARRLAALAECQISLGTHLTSEWSAARRQVVHAAASSSGASPGGDARLDSAHGVRAYRRQTSGREPAHEHRLHRATKSLIRRAYGLELAPSAIRLLAEGKPVELSARRGGAGPAAR